MDPLQDSALGPYSAPSDPQLARAMTFACRAHGMTSSLTQQTFGAGRGGEGEEDHMKFSQTEGGSAIFLLLPRRDQLS